MTSALSMSLEDLIQANKTANRSQRGNSRGGAVRRGRNNGARPSASPYTSQAGRLEQTKIMISNLAPSVSENDLQELFKPIGPIKSAVLNFDASGRSKGTGTVIFRRNGDASKAVETYHNRTLDGKPMKLELVVSAQAVTALASAASTAPTSGAGGRGSGRGGRGGRGRGRREGRKTMTVDELDAQMDSYMKDDTMADASAPLAL